MKLEFDTTEFKNPCTLGPLLMMFSDFYHGGLYHRGTSDGWRPVNTTDRKYVVAVMGDNIYDELENTKYSHFAHNNGLNVVWYCDAGDDNILFYKEGDDAFAIINDKNGLSNRWQNANLNDPRNDPNYDAFPDDKFG